MIFVAPHSVYSLGHPYTFQIKFKYNSVNPEGLGGQIQKFTQNFMSFPKISSETSKTS